MISDVPLGAFLSGGIDSSAIVSLMQERSRRPVRTFTIGFTESKYDESNHAEAVARHLGTQHTTLIVTPSQVLDVVPRLPEIYSEPFADSSQIPTSLVSTLARKHVTVSLSGDGGDELFFGYSRYPGTVALKRNLERIPVPVRRIAAKLLSSRAMDTLVRSGHRLGSLFPGTLSACSRLDRWRDSVPALRARTQGELYRAIVSYWQTPTSVIPGAVEPYTSLESRDLWSTERSFAEAMMEADAMTYLCDDILVKVDRAAMGVSLESRVPLLDHRVFEFAWTLPFHLKQQAGISKWILRQVLYRYVPQTLMERPKMGFRVPIAEWLRGPLRPWAEELLSESRLRHDGYFDPQIVRCRWIEHLSGVKAWHNQLWSVLMFNAWIQHSRAS